MDAQHNESLKWHGADVKVRGKGFSIITIKRLGQMRKNTSAGGNWLKEDWPGERPLAVA